MQMFPNMPFVYEHSTYSGPLDLDTLASAGFTVVMRQDDKTAAAVNSWRMVRQGERVVPCS